MIKLKRYLKNEDFLLTYGDGLANIKIDKLLDFYKKTLMCNDNSTTTCKMGSCKIKRKKIIKFEEKNQINEGWINGGFLYLIKIYLNNLIKTVIMYWKLIFYLKYQV